MRGLAICGRSVYAHSASIDTVDIDGVSIPCGILETADRTLSASEPAMVLVRVHGFSCNYRDKKLIVRAATCLPANRFLLIGSEFVGTVVAVGAGVRRVRLGDRVMGDNSYPHIPDRAHGGVPTNAASGEYLALHEDKVIGVPNTMPDEVAAAFTLGAQTAFSMVRKLDAQPGEPILVTAARSNTSLFAIEALRDHAADVYAMTSSARDATRLRARGVRAVLPATDAGAWDATARAVGGFASVIDPFFDLHLRTVLPLMRNGGRYVTCGCHNQDATASDGDYRQALCTAMVKNISIIGNCVGLRADLEHAIGAYTRRSLDVPIDSVFDGDRAGDFLTRTFAAPDRFGKVVYAYH